MDDILFCLICVEYYGNGCLFHFVEILMFWLDDNHCYWNCSQFCFTHRWQKMNSRNPLVARYSAWIRWFLEKHGWVEGIFTETVIGFSRNIPTFGWFLWSMLVNIPYMDPMGYQEPPKMKMLPEKGTIFKRKQPSSSSPIMFLGIPRWWFRNPAN